MKNAIYRFTILIFCTLTIFLSINSYGQRKNSYGQNIKMYKADRVILSASYLQWNNLPPEIGLKNINRGFNLGYFIDNPLGGSRFSFGFGGSITSINLYSDAIPTYIVSAPCTSSDFIKIKDLCTATNTFRTNKLTFNYLALPIEIRLRLGKDEYWKIAFGFEAGYLVSSYLKYEGDNVFLQTSDDIKFKYFNIRNASNWRYGTSFRAGYNRFGIRIFYPLSTTFRKTSQIQIFPIELGLTLMVF